MPVARPAPFTSTRPVMALSRISAPAASARGSQAISTLCFALVEHPSVQNPR